MVAKINIGSNLYGALTYNQEKVDKGLGKRLGANLVFEPADGHFNVIDCIEDFMQFIPSLFRIEQHVVAVSLNPHEADILTDDQLVDIGIASINRVGYGHAAYLTCKQEDI